MVNRVKEPYIFPLHADCMVFTPLTMTIEVKLD